MALMILNFQSNTCDSHLENIHLHVNLNFDFLSPKGAITHPLINLELLFLLCLINLMIKNTYGKFQSNLSSSYFNKRPKRACIRSTGFIGEEMKVLECKQSDL